MKEIFIEENNLTSAYHKALVLLYKEGSLVDCKDWNCKQKEISATIVINNPLQEPMISRLCITSPEALEQYVEELLEGVMDFEIGHIWDYTYHDRIVNYKVYNNVYETLKYNRYRENQIDFVVDELTRNPESRRAVIDVRCNEDDMHSNDPACLNHLQFFIRDNKLHLKVLFRSNDLCRASWMNMFGLIMLQKQVADRLDIEVGTYTHRANSLHCYEESFKDLENYVKAIKDKPIEKLTFNYKNNWDKKMEASKLTIKDKVEKLKSEVYKED